MKLSLNLLVTEFFVLFILLPVSFVFSYSIWIKAILVVLGFIYILWTLHKVHDISFRIKKPLDWYAFWKRTLLTFAVIVIVTTAFVWFTDASLMFYVIKNNPLIFIFILPIYTLLSAWPQEMIYRTFFYAQYEHLFKSKALLIFVNAIIFSLAHIFFRNTLVLILTFIGGILFSLTYLKFRSTTLVSIEHALYGNWLFTIGMGEMLAFPGMEAP